MSPIKITRKTLLFFLPAVGIIVLFIFISNPKLKKIKELSAQILQENVKLKETKKIAQTKDLLIQEISKMKDEIDYYERRIPSEKATAWLLMELSRIARETGIKYVSISPQKEEIQESFVRVPIQVQIKSGYHGFGNYLSKIENSERFMTVDNVTIIPSGESPLIHNVTLTISTFMFVK